MSKKQKEPTAKEFVGAVMFLVGEIIGHLGRGLFFGLGFWWAFHLLMN